MYKKIPPTTMSYHGGNFYLSLKDRVIKANKGVVRVWIAMGYGNQFYPRTEAESKIVESLINIGVVEKVAS